MKHLILEVRDLTKTYPNRGRPLTVLRSVSFAVAQGAACAIVGPSGSGKTTLLGLCAGLDRATSGSVVLDGGRTLRPAPRPPVPVVDPIGAGDAYVAGFLWCLLRDRPLQEAVDVAAAVGALKCSLWGDIALIDPADVDDALGGGGAVRR